MIKIAVVEDNKTLRRSLEQLFNQMTDMRCVAAVGHVMNIVSDLLKADPDIVLMDIGLPNIDGIEGVRTVKTNFPNVQVLMFTVFEEEDKIFEAIRAGASGYLLKKTAPAEILQSVRELHGGGAPMSPSIAKKVIASFQQVSPMSINEYQLTVREKEILYSLVDGLSYKKIADKYVVSISTIRTHICHIYHKLHVNSKSQAVAKVLQRKPAV